MVVQETYFDSNNKIRASKERNEMKFKLASSVKRLILLVVFLTLAMSVLAACGNGTGNEGENGAREGKLQVTTTTGMIADLAREIGGDHVEVVGLMGPGVDPHLYKATQGDIAKLENADVILYGGLHLEGKMTDILVQMAKDRTVVPVTEGIPEDRLRILDEETEDPHVWFDVSLWMLAAEKVRDVLSEADAANKAAYEQNAEAYLKELEELDAYVKEQISSIPEPSRVLVTAHDAFGYFGDAYGMEVVGLQGISTASEYGSKDVMALRDLIVERGIKAVFVESSVSTQSIEAVIEGAKEKGHEVVIGGELFSDAMGAEGTPEGTYIGMVRHNAETIANALK